MKNTGSLKHCLKTMQLLVYQMKT